MRICPHVVYRAEDLLGARINARKRFSANRLTKAPAMDDTFRRFSHCVKQLFPITLSVKRELTLDKFAQSHKHGNIPPIYVRNMKNANVYRRRRLGFGVEKFCAFYYFYRRLFYRPGFMLAIRWGAIEDLHNFKSRTVARSREIRGEDLLICWDGPNFLVDFLAGVNKPSRMNVSDRPLANAVSRGIHEWRLLTNIYDRFLYAD